MNIDKKFTESLLKDNKISFVENHTKTEQVYKDGKLYKVSIWVDKNMDNKYTNDEIKSVEFYQYNEDGTSKSIKFQDEDGDENHFNEKATVYKRDAYGNILESYEEFDEKSDVTMESIYEQNEIPTSPMVRSLKRFTKDSGITIKDGKIVVPEPKIENPEQVEKDYAAISYSITDPKEAEAKKIAEQLSEVLKNPNEFGTSGRIIGILQGMLPEYTALVMKYIPDLVQQLDAVNYEGRGLGTQDIVKFFGLNLLERYNQMFPGQTEYTKESLEAITSTEELANVLKTMTEKINDNDAYKLENEVISKANRTIAEAANMKPALRIKSGENEVGKYKQVHLPDGRAIRAYIRDEKIWKIEIDVDGIEEDHNGVKSHWNDIVLDSDSVYVDHAGTNQGKIYQPEGYDFNKIKEYCEKIFGLKKNQSSNFGI